VVSKSSCFDFPAAQPETSTVRYVTTLQPEAIIRVVCGIELALVATEGGGRQAALLGGAGPGFEFKYRPNWGLPGMTPPEQSGAMVYGFSRHDIAPGSSCRAVIVQLVPETLEWQQVREGLTLPCYEGNRVVAHGRVLWRELSSTSATTTGPDGSRGWPATPLTKTR
jgi:hypothetical protein